MFAYSFEMFSLIMDNISLKPPCQQLTSKWHKKYCFSCF